MTRGFEEFSGASSSMCRVILFDRRGTGASDGVSRDAIPTWEDGPRTCRGARCGRVRARRDLRRGRRGPVAVLFAAMHPSGCRALLLFNTRARYLRDDDYPIGVSGRRSRMLRGAGGRHRGERSTSCVPPTPVSRTPSSSRTPLWALPRRNAADGRGAVRLHLQARRCAARASAGAGPHAGAPCARQPHRAHRARSLPRRPHRGREVRRFPGGVCHVP